VYERYDDNRRLDNNIDSNIDIFVSSWSVWNNGVCEMKKKKLKSLDKYVIFALCIVLMYTIAEFITATVTGVEKSTLTTAVYGFWAGEVVTCGLIKIFKLKKEDKYFGTD